MSEKFAFIDAERAQPAGLPTVERMCGLLEVSKSGFYEWRGRPASAAQQRRVLLADKIGALFEAFGGTYGYRRIHAELLRSGEWVGPELVRDLMGELGLVAAHPRPFRTTTDPDPNAPAGVDLVNRDFTATRPGTKVVGDITYVRTWQGWLYLASLIDCATREVIGYAMAEHMRTELVLDAVDMAMRNHRLDRIVLCIPIAVRNTPRPNTARNSVISSYDIRSGGPVNVGIMRSRNRFSRP